MSEQKHTPGPWRLEGSVIRGGSDALNIFHVPVGIVNDVAVSGCPSRKEAKANAHLIAAAPDLLEACNLHIETLSKQKRNGEPLDSESLNRAQKMMIKAIAKAEGEQQ